MTQGRRFLGRGARSLAIELVIVFLSVFLAFQVDGWRERLDREEATRLALERVRGDVRADLESLRRSSEIAEDRLFRGRRAVLLLNSGPPFDSAAADSLSSFLNTSFGGGRISQAGYQLLVSQGLLGHVEPSLQEVLVDLSLAGARMEQSRLVLQEQLKPLEDHSEYFMVGVTPSEGSLFSGRPNARIYDVNKIRPSDMRLRSLMLRAVETHQDWFAALVRVFSLAERADSILSAYPGG